MLDNEGTVILRYTLNGAASAAGNNRIDNLQLNATPIPKIDVVIELPHLDAGQIERCIRFTLTGPAEEELTVQETILFIDTLGSATLILPEPYTLADFDCIAARNPLHTLTRTLTLTHGEPAEFTGPSALLGGDLNDRR